MLKKNLLLILMSVTLSTPLLAQYVGVSPYFNEPSLSIGYVDSCAQFWMQTLDPVRGGFYTNIDRQGNVISSWGTNKNLLTQTRNAYGFVRAYMLTGNDSYREYAQAGLAFMYDHAWDSVHGGWYAQLDVNGNPQGTTDGRSAFDAHYALLGPAAAFEAFGDSLDLGMLSAGYDHLENFFWDDRQGFSGYYDWTTYNGSAAYDKSFNATVDAITTHLLSLYLQTGDQIYLDRMHAICQQILDHLVTSMPAQAIGFVEEYDSNWNWDNGETMTIMGHVLKSAWCLARVYGIDPRPDYLDAAQMLVADVLEHGYDQVLGGPYKDYNRTTGEMLMWGNPDTAKAWWQMEQAITAGYTLWSITGEESYLDMADKSLHFFMRYFVDHTYGDVYENRTRYGGETWGLNKGGGGKAAYHSIETGYYNYLYGSLFVHGEPVELYYWFEPEVVDRAITLNPVSSTFTPLSITQVKLDDVEYGDFVPATRILNIPAGLGGEFKVTFSPNAQSGIASANLPVRARLEAAYPNPFNGQTHLDYTLAASGPVLIRIFDLQGHELATLVDESQEAGSHGTAWNGLDQAGRSLPTGLYLVQAELGELQQSQKVLLLK